jgi:hypothetical protein
MNKKNNILKLRVPITLSFIATLFLLGFNSPIHSQTIKTDSIKPEEKRRFFTFTPITEAEFRNALENNYNAPFTTQIEDTTKLEKAFEPIAKTYNEDEHFFAESELCESPRCLTHFKAYYPTLDLYLFTILEINYEKAVFVFAGSNKMASGRNRFRGSYGVMSKDGLWVGLKRDDCDNNLQIEICKSSEIGVWSVFTFDFTYIDINFEKKPALFWADKNTIYLETLRYEPELKDPILEYYSIVFEY